MIRIWLLVALVACSKSPRTSHEEAAPPPTTRPFDAQVFDAQVFDAQVFDAQVFDAQIAADATSRADSGVKAKPDAGAHTDKPDGGVDATEKLGKAGDVCAKGTRSRDPDAPASSKAVVQCGKGLVCCYPCGIPGCDSVCKASCPRVP